MAIVFGDAVQQTTNSSGSPFVMNSGVSPGFQTVQQVVASGQQTSYAILDNTGNREVGLGTVIDASGTIQRTTLLQSIPTSGTPPVFQPGAVVWINQPAYLVQQIQFSGQIVGLASGAVTSGNIASGQVGPFHMASGAVLSGTIASGQIGKNHLASG